jgi:hypothetical protein
MGRRSGVPLGSILIGAVFIFLILVLMIIPVLPFEVTANEQLILYAISFIVMGGMLVMLMRYAI